MGIDPQGSTVVEGARRETKTTKVTLSDSPLGGLRVRIRRTPSDRRNKHYVTYTSLGETSTKDTSVLYYYYRVYFQVHKVGPCLIHPCLVSIYSVTITEACRVPGEVP